jgi:hypothetical protein
VLRGEIGMACLQRTPSLARRASTVLAIYRTWKKLHLH